MPPALICAVFTPGKKLSYDFVAIANKPCSCLVFLGKSPALALLPISAGDGLPAGRLNLIPYLVMFCDAVVIDRLSLPVDCFHVLSFLPVQPIGQLLNLHSVSDSDSF